MSKKKQFHNLIEQGDQEEKARVWGKIQGKELAQKQNEPTMVEMKPKKCGVFFTRKFTAWAGVVALAMIFSVVGFTQFLLRGQIERPGGNANPEAMPNTSDTQQEETTEPTSPGFSYDNETSEDDFGDESGEQGVPGDSGAQAPQAPQPPQGEGGDQEEGDAQGPSFENYYTSSDYTKRDLDKTLQEYAPSLLYFESLYDNTCLTFIYESKDNQALVYLQESYPVPELQGNVTLCIAAQDVFVEDLLAYENRPEAKTKTIHGVTVEYHITELDNGAFYGYAFFLYQGQKYYVTVTEASNATTLDEEYLLALIEKLWK